VLNKVHRKNNSKNPPCLISLLAGSLVPFTLVPCTFFLVACVPHSIVYSVVLNLAMEDVYHSPLDACSLYFCSMHAFFLYFFPCSVVPYSLVPCTLVPCTLFPCTFPLLGCSLLACTLGASPMHFFLGRICFVLHSPAMPVFQHNLNSCSFFPQTFLSARDEWLKKLVVHHSFMIAS
jgi:hypothetical protein